MILACRKSFFGVLNLSRVPPYDRPEKGHPIEFLNQRFNCQVAAFKIHFPGFRILNLPSGTGWKNAKWSSRASFPTMMMTMMPSNLVMAVGWDIGMKGFWVKGFWG